MDIEIERVDGVTVATLFGELDGRTAPALEQKLLSLPEADGRVLLDMHGVTYISSAGLRALLMLYRQIAAQRGEVALAGLNEDIKDVMSITGFLEFFAAYDSIDAGVEALKK